MKIKRFNDFLAVKDEGVLLGNWPPSVISGTPVKSVGGMHSAMLGVCTVTNQPYKLTDKPGICC